MPFIVTTKRPLGVSKSLAPACRVSRHAVATLEEAKRAAADAIYSAEAAKGKGAVRCPSNFDPFYEAVTSIPESGGSVGPLPDGTVIEVEATTWGALREALTMPSGLRPHDPDLAAQIIAIWNAREAE